VFGFFSGDCQFARILIFVSVLRIHLVDSLKKIIRGCLKNIKSDQYKFYSHFSQKMYGVCLRYAGSYDEAQDILQEGFIKVFEKLHTFREQGSLEGWVKRIMINTAIEKYRERIYYLSVEDLSENGGHAEDNSGPEKLGLSELLNLIQILPDQYRLVFNLSVLEGMSHKEIGEMLGISESTSRSNLSRARTILQDWIIREKKIVERAI
jgi:RNA polymerase sigma factor (sigma-70 family)